ncbi:THUMP domain-containing protein [Methanocaldococcus villosus KIN24-T80]|uniref:THUMP domain-containing protein n=2 Tax=Methanocaldococcus villosus TaxID=667126 RepID=N6VP47_9EURY|nr:THUMP domain-containing protein [Methanocaldococcus villosus KIN24-T80]
MLITTKPGFEPYLMKELKKRGYRVRYTIFRGILLLEDDLKDFNINYIFKAIPIERACSLENLKETIFNLIKEKNLKGKFVVRVNRRGRHKFTSEELEKFLGKEIVDNFNLKVDLKNYDFKINIEILQDKVYVSIFDKNFKEIVFKKNIEKLEKINRYKERPLNRSERKMSELMEKFPFIFENLNTVLDIGSAPGGWVKVLSKRAKKVYAIDRADLKVKADNIIHIKEKAENVNIDEEVDLITNDTNLYPKESMILTLKFLKNLKSGGYIIQTVKSCKENIKNDINEVINLAKDLELFKVVKLKANTKNEITLIFKKH